MACPASVFRVAATARVLAPAQNRLGTGRLWWRFDQARGRGVVDAEAIGTVVRVDNEHWSGQLFGRERQLLNHVIGTAREGDAGAVMAAMDSFWEKTFSMAGTDAWSIRGHMLDKAVLSRAPRTCLEIGTYCGYSALRIASRIPAEGRLVTLEVDPLYAAIAAKIVEYAGLSDRVKVLVGTVVGQTARLEELLRCPRGHSEGEQRPVDFVLCDHSKEQFVPDIKLLEELGVVGEGSVVMGDTTVYPGEPDRESGKELLSYFSHHPMYAVQQHMATMAHNGITISKWHYCP